MLRTTDQLASRALAFAVRCHAGQRRDSDGAPFINHPLEVARLLRDAGCDEALVVAGLLHDVVEETEVELSELSQRFGSDVAALVDAVTDDSCVDGYELRKQILRDQVRFAGSDVALLFAADKISKVREWSSHARRDQERLRDVPGDSRTRRFLEHHSDMRLEHYRASLVMLEHVVPGHQLVTQLAQEIERCCGEHPAMN